MGILANRLPPSEKEKYIDRHWVPGQVLYLYCPFIRDPKDKYVLLTCTADPPVLMLINSNIPGFIATRAHMLQCQVKLKASQYDFLDHDSYLNCAQSYDRLDTETIRRQLRADLGRIKGKLSKNTIRQVVQATRSANQLMPRHQTRILDAFS